MPDYDVENANGDADDDDDNVDHDDDDDAIGDFDARPYLQGR